MDSMREILLTKYVSNKRTICEVHREIYDILLDLPDGEKKEQAIDLIEEAFKMAKSMNRKLFEYKSDWDKGVYKKQSKAAIKRKKTKRKRR